MKTHTAPWDYERPLRIANALNDVCPQCGLPCGSIPLPDERTRFYCYDNCGAFDMENAHILEWLDASPDTLEAGLKEAGFGSAGPM